LLRDSGGSGNHAGGLFAVTRDGAKLPTYEQIGRRGKKAPCKGTLAGAEVKTWRWGGVGEIGGGGKVHNKMGLRRTRNGIDTSTSTQQGDAFHPQLGGRSGNARLRELCQKIAAFKGIEHEEKRASKLRGGMKRGKWS